MNIEYRDMINTIKIANKFKKYLHDLSECLKKGDKYWITNKGYNHLKSPFIVNSLRKRHLENDEYLVDGYFETKDGNCYCLIELTEFNTENKIEDVQAPQEKS